MDISTRMALLNFIADECSKDPTLPSDLFKAITEGLVAGLKQERQKSSDLAYALSSVAGLAEGNKVMKNRLLHYKTAMQAGWRVLYNHLASTPIQKKLEQYLIEENEEDKN